MSDRQTTSDEWTETVKARALAKKVKPRIVKQDWATKVVAKWQHPEDDWGLPYLRPEQVVRLLRQRDAKWMRAVGGRIKGYRVSAHLSSNLVIKQQWVAMAVAMEDLLDAMKGNKA